MHRDRVHRLELAFSCSHCFSMRSIYFIFYFPCPPFPLSLSFSFFTFSIRFFIKNPLYERDSKCPANVLLGGVLSPITTTKILSLLKQDSFSISCAHASHNRCIQFIIQSHCIEKKSEINIHSWINDNNSTFLYLAGSLQITRSIMVIQWEPSQMKHLNSILMIELREEQKLSPQFPLCHMDVCFEHREIVHSTICALHAINKSGWKNCRLSFVRSRDLMRRSIAQKKALLHTKIVESMHCNTIACLAVHLLLSFLCFSSVGCDSNITTIHTHEKNICVACVWYSEREYVCCFQFVNSLPRR